MFALTGIAAFALSWFSIAQGVGISPDSVHYVHVARELAAGNGLTYINGSGQRAPLNWWPPLYPGILAAGKVVLCQDPLNFARAVDAACFSLSVLLAMAMARTATGSMPSTALAGALALAAPKVLWVYNWAWSEPPFLVLLLAGLLLLSMHLAKGGWATLLASGAVLGMVPLTRYVGGLVVPLGLVLILAISQQPARKRIAQGLVFAAIVALPIALWAVHNRLAGTSATGRSLDASAVPERKIQHMLLAITNWLLPGTKQCVMLVIGLLALTLSSAACLLAMHWRAAVSRIRGSTGGCLLVSLAVFAGSYLPALLLSIKFVDHGTPLSDRTLCPIFAPLLVLAIAGGTWLWRLLPPGGGRIALRLALLLIAAGELSYNGWRTVAQARVLHRDGMEKPGCYSSRQWRHSRTIAWINAQPQDLTIYTNAYDAIYILTGRHARDLPTGKQLREGQKNPLVRQVLQDLGDRRACVVFFGATKRRKYPTAQGLADALNLEPLPASSGKDQILQLSTHPRRPAPTQPAAEPEDPQEDDAL